MGDITLNSGPFHMNQTSGNNEWDVFKAHGLHFIHININSLLPKLEEFCSIASLTQLLLGFQNQNQKIQRLKLMAIIFCILTEIDTEEG